MKRRFLAFVPLLCLPASCALAQTVIGGGTCSSATLSGVYEFSLNGRQLTPSGTVTRLLQGVGTANFDGLSKVTFTLTANTVTSSQAFGTPLVYSGTYSLQSNCVGSIDITSGDNATFTLEAYNQASPPTPAAGFAVIGSDASYAYNGTGNNQPATCPTTISGAHEFNGTGDGLSGASVTSVLDVAGVLNFNGSGNVTANWTAVSNTTSTPVTASGTYTVGSNCLASGTLTDTANNQYAFSLSFDSASPSFSLAVSSPTVIFDGSGADVQPAAVTSCSPAMLSGTYEMALSGRMVTNQVATRILQAGGSATFDGQSHVTFNLTSNAVNGSQTFGTEAQWQGTYSLNATCQGAINMTSGDVAGFSLVAYSVDATTLKARSFEIVGTDATYGYSGGGTVQPTACNTATLSGGWAFSGTGNTLSGTTNTGVADIAGTMAFDGQGNVTASWTEATNTATTNYTASGTYAVTANCLGSLTLKDNNSTQYAGTVAIYGADGDDFEWVTTTPQLILAATGRSTFVNPGEALDNNSSFAVGETPAGSVFSLFGSSLATKTDQPTTLPLPTTVLTTSMTINGVAAPLFYVSSTQLVAQMPYEVQPGLATVIVKNGTSTSNAVAVMIPSTATPQIGVYNTNRAVVTDIDYNLNTAANPAQVGDTLVAWFTGGGPVEGPKLTTGAVSPTGELVPQPYSITVGGANATVSYIGLTPGSIGLYQANFVVPSVASGTQAVVITINGTASNAPVINVK